MSKNKINKKVKRSYQDMIFDLCNNAIMSIIVIIMLYPMWHVLIASVSDSNYLAAHRGILLAPLNFTLEAYRLVMKNPNILSGYVNTIFVVVVGTIGSTFITAIGAYALARKNYPFKRIVTFFIIFTMYFGGGIIPRYLLLANGMNMRNNIWVLIIPHLVTTYNLIVMRTGFEGIPDSLEESARIDGASDFRILFQIIIPVALPTVAVIVLFYAVSYWNSWFDATIFINDRNKYPLQVVMREILIANSTESMTAGEAGDRVAIGESIKYAAIMISTLPILFVYPFVQKYFVKGMTVGAVKG